MNEYKHDGIVTVVQQGSKDCTYSCGVVVRPGMVVTSSDIADNSDEIEVYRHCHVWKIAKATIRMHDNDKGFCLLNVDTPDLGGAIAKIQPYDKLEQDDKVSAVFWMPDENVCDAHFQPTKNIENIRILSGIIKQLWESEDIRYIGTNINLPPGASGGGLFNSEGKLVGIPISRHNLLWCKTSGGIYSLSPEVSANP